MIIYEKGEGESATRTAQVFIVTESSEGKPVMVMFLGPEGEVTKDYVQANLSTVK